MKLRSTLFFAAASLSASALLPVAATTSAFFAASAVPAMADEIALTQGEMTNLGSGNTGEGNTYISSGGANDTTGSWIGWDTGNSAEENTFSGALSGNGLVGFLIRGGDGGVTYNVNLSGASATNFSGRLTVENNWDNNTVANISGTGLSKVEYVFAGVSYEEGWKYYRGIGNKDRGQDTLNITGATTLAGISGTSEGFTSSGWDFNAHEAITVSSGGTVLTLSGGGNYEFYGTVGASNSRVGVSVTNGTTQTFGGDSNFLADVTIDGGSTLKVGTGSITGAITGKGTLEIVAGGTLVFDGSATFSGGTLSTAAGSTLSVAGTLDLSGAQVDMGTTIAVAETGSVTVSGDTIFALDGMVADGNDTYTIFTVADGQTVSGWESLDPNKNFTLGGTALSDLQGYRVGTVSRTDYGITMTVNTGLNLTWNGGQPGTWDTTSKNWTMGDTTNAQFFKGDNVTFDTADAKVTLVGDLTPAGVTINAETTFTGAGTVSVAPESLTIEEGASLTLAGGVTLDFGTINGGSIEKTIVSSAPSQGTVKVITTASGYGTTVNLGSDFNGTLDYTGKFNPNNMTPGKMLGKEAVIALSSSNTNVDSLSSMWGGDTGTISNDIILKTDYQIGDSRGTTITINGNITAENGARLKVHQGGTSFTLGKDAVAKLGGYIVNADGEEKRNSTTIYGVMSVSGSVFSVDMKVSSFLISQGAGEHTLTVEDGGVLNLTNVGVANRDGTGVLTINSGGEANFNAGLHVMTHNAGWGRATVNLNGGRMNIGTGAASSTGITTDGKENVRINLNSGTIGSLADSWLSALDFKLGGAITVDTTKMTYSEDGKATETNAGSSVTLSGVLSGDGSLTKTGAGTLELNNNNAYSGGTTVEEGTLVAAHANALGTGTVSVAGGTLDMASVAGIANTISVSSGTVQNFRLDEGRLEISSSATADSVTLGGLILDGGVIAFADDVSWTTGGSAFASISDMSAESSGVTLEVYIENWALNDTYTLFSLDDGSKSVWETLIADGGYHVLTFGTAKLSISADNLLQVTLTAEAETLTWGGGDGEWTVAEGWLAGSDSVAWSDNFAARFDEKSAGATVTTSGFISAAEVSVAVGAGNSLTLTGDAVFKPDSLKISVESGTLRWDIPESAAGTAGFAGDFEISDGATLDVVREGDYAMVNAISGAGTLRYGVAGSTLTLSGDSSAFTGTLDVDAGTVVLAKLATTTTTGEGNAYTLSTSRVNFSTEIAEGAEVAVDASVGTTYHELVFSDVSGAGTLRIDVSSGPFVRVDIGDGGFVGTVELNGAGDFVAADDNRNNVTTVLTASNFGAATVRLVNNAALNFTNTGADFGNDIEVGEGGGRIRAFGDNTVEAGRGVTLSGKVSGTGTLSVSDGGDVAFTGNVDVGGLAVNDGTTANFSGSETRLGSVNVSNGTLNFSGNADVSALTVSNGTVNFSGGGDVGSLTFDCSDDDVGNVAFKGKGTTYTLGAVEQSETASYKRNLSVDEGVTVTVNATSLTNNYGMGALTVNGELNFSGDLKFATGSNNSTENNVIAGTGIIRANSLTFGNVGTYNISVNCIEIGSGGIIYAENNGQKHIPIVNLGATTIVATESWSNGYGDDVATPELTLVSVRAEGEDGSVSGGTTFEIEGAGTVAEIEAKILGEGTLVKTGEGTLTLSGTNTYTGGTTVEAGTLQLMLGGDYTAGDVSVASDATLQLSTSGDAVDFGGTEEDPVTLTFGEGGVLSVGEGTVNLTERTKLAFTGANGSAVDASKATLTYRSGEEGGTLIFASDREFGKFVFDSQGTVSSASVGKSATLSAGELIFSASANRAAEMSGEGTLAVGKIFVNNTRSGNKISVDTLELTQAETAETAETAGTEIFVERHSSLEISSEKIVFSEGVENGTLVKTGAGTLTVGDAFQNDFVGSLHVKAGTVSTNLLNLSGALTLAAGTTFDGSVDASAGSRVDLGAGARIDGDLTVSGTEMTFNGTVSGIGTLTWGDGNGINLGEAFRAEISSAGNGVLLDFDVGLDGDGNALTEDFDFDFDASALADSFLGRDVDLVYNEKDTSIEIVVTGALVWNETVTHWTVSGAGSSGHEHDQWDVVTRDGVSEESAFFENGDFVQFTTAGSTRLVGTVNGGWSFAGKGTEPRGDGIVRTAGIVFDIEGGGTFKLDSKKRYNGDGELVDDGQSFLVTTTQGKDEGITVLNGDVTIGKNVVNNLVGGTKIYGGSLTVYTADALGKADELGNVSIEVGNTASATRATLTFAQEGELTFAQEGELAVDRKISISVGNANAQIGVTNADAVVSLDRVVKNAAAEEGAALTKLGAGTLNIARGDYADAELLDRVAVNAGTLTFTGDDDDDGLPTRNVSVASGATLNVEHGGSEVEFDAMDVAGTVNIGTAENATDRSFSARTISATGSAGEISGALQLDGEEFEVEIDGVTKTYKGTLFYAEDADQSLAFTGTVSVKENSEAALADADSKPALYKAGAGTVSFASGTKGEKFQLDADLVLDGGTVSFGEGVAASGELRVTGGNTRIEVSRTSGTHEDGKSSFSDLTVSAGAGVTFALGNGMWTTDSVSDAKNIGLTLSGDIDAKGGSVAFASTGGSSTLRGTVSIENAENAQSATFGQLTVGGTGTNIVDLSVGNNVKFSADAVTLYGASSLNFAKPQEGQVEATIGALEVIDNAGNAAKLDLGGGTLSLENDENVAVLYGDGTLRISNGTLNVKGQNYSEKLRPGIVLVDGATFNFDVDAGTGTDANGAVVYTSLREITTEGSGGTVSKSGAGTLVLYLDDETGQPVGSRQARRGRDAPLRDAGGRRADRRLRRDAAAVHDGEDRRRRNHSVGR